VHFRKWYHKLKNDQTDIHDDCCIRQPRKSRMEVNVPEVKLLLGHTKELGRLPLPSQ
jgi:hypothetical protein